MNDDTSKLPGADAPSEAAPFETPAGATSTSPRDLRDADGARVLIVEGLPDLRQLLVERFEREGFEVHAGEDAEVGFAAALRLRPRLIVVNEKIVDADGTTLASRIREHPATARTPLIVLTARPVAQAGSGTATGATPHATEGIPSRRTAQITLPFRPQELIELARESL